MADFLLKIVYVHFLSLNNLLPFSHKTNANLKFMSLVPFVLCVFNNIYVVEFETGSLKKFSRLFRRNLTLLTNAERICLKFRRPIQKLLLIKIFTTNED